MNKILNFKKKLNIIKSHLSNDYTVLAQDGIMAPIYSGHKNIHLDADNALVHISYLAKHAHISSDFEKTLIVNNIINKTQLESLSTDTLGYFFSNQDIQFIKKSKYHYFDESTLTNLLTPLDVVDFIDDLNNYLDEKTSLSV